MFTNLIWPPITLFFPTHYLSHNRTLIHGDKKGGFTVFWADDGLDTGPILLQRECAVEANDTVNTIYKRFLFPEGVRGMVRDDILRTERTSAEHTQKTMTNISPTRSRVLWHLVQCRFFSPIPVPFKHSRHKKKKCPNNGSYLAKLPGRLTDSPYYIWNIFFSGSR